MRRFLICLIGAAIVASVAVAQQTPQLRPTVSFEPIDANVFARNFPSNAADRNISGLTKLCCTVQPDRTLACDTLYEWPEGHGFGQASVITARSIRVTQASYDALRATGDMSVTRILNWILPYRTEERQRQMAEATEHARAMACPVTASPPVGGR